MIILYKLKGGVIIPRPKKPASMRTGHDVSKSKLLEQMEAEEKLKGDSDKLSDVPNIIKMNPNAVEYYKMIVLMLKDSDVISNRDRIAIADMADSLAKYQEANEDLQTRGKTIIQYTKSGEKEVINPQYQYYKDASNSFKKAATQFGLTPSSRAQLSEVAMEKKSAEEDPFTVMMSKFDEKSKKSNTEKGSDKGD